MTFLESTNTKVAQHAGARELAAKYTRGKRIQEIVSIVVSTALLVYIGRKIISNTDSSNALEIVLLSLLGVVAADFASGMLHWACDSWGSVDMPLVGPSFLRSFREHHIDPTAITRHDFIEANGDSFLAIAPLLLFVALRCDVPGTERMNAFIFFLSLFAGLTNQLHKWSHMQTANLPRFVAFLQRSRLILPNWHHHVHHISPHATYFCITTGWLNEPLERIRFWVTVERVITFITGAVPRSDDLVWARKTN